MELGRRGRFEKLELKKGKEKKGEGKIY